MLSASDDHSRALALGLALAASAWLVECPLAQAQSPASKATPKKANGFRSSSATPANTSSVSGRMPRKMLAGSPSPSCAGGSRCRGGDDGALYLWVRDGRPVAAVTFFTFKLPEGTRWVTHEHHSFAAEPVEATWKDNDRLAHLAARPGIQAHPQRPAAGRHPPCPAAPVAGPGARLLGQHRR